MPKNFHKKFLQYLCVTELWVCACKKRKERQFIYLLSSPYLFRIEFYSDSLPSRTKQPHKPPPLLLVSQVAYGVSMNILNSLSEFSEREGHPPIWLFAYKSSKSDKDLTYDYLWKKFTLGKFSENFCENSWAYTDKGVTHLYWKHFLLDSSAQKTLILEMVAHRNGFYYGSNL